MQDGRYTPASSRLMKQTVESRLAQVFRMSDEVWQRHANPWSVWTFSTLPLLILAIWSRVWLGHWAWALVGLSLLWLWVNPRYFDKPKSTRNWASMGVLGERVWLNRKNIDIPPRHRGTQYFKHTLCKRSAVARLGPLAITNLANTNWYYRHLRR